MSRESDETGTVPPHDQRARMDLVLKYFVEGMSIPTIVQQLKQRHGIEVGREVPYQDISRATSRRWLKYEAPREQELSARLHERYREKGLLDAFVPSFGERMTVMDAGARLCAEAIWNIAQEKTLTKALGATRSEREEGRNLQPWSFPVAYEDSGGKRIVKDFAELKGKTLKRGDLEPEPIEIEIRIGFSGGYTMSVTSRDLGHTIASRVEDWERDLKGLVLETLEEHGFGSLLPKKIVKRRFKVGIKFVFVNLISGFDPEPLTNPIAFLTSVMEDEILSKRTTLQIFNAMPFVEIGKGRTTIEEVDTLWDVRHDYEKHGFDIILTSGSSISDPHSTFRSYYNDSRISDLLIERGVQGDYFWLPVTANRPFSLRGLKEDLKGSELGELLKYRPMTLLTLEDLAAHVSNGRDVFFILAPCAKCLLDKAQIGRAVLGQEDPIVTHLVVDRDSAEGILKEGE